MKVLSIVGARPQFIKAAPVSRALRGLGHHEILVHTGQHYDDAMSAVFFRDLDLPPPDRDLEVGSGSHAAQTAEILRRLEPVLLDEAPDVVVIYGDTNSTLAGAVTTAKLVPTHGRRPQLAHVEAGLRSFNRDMPEERNRIVADHLSDLLLAPTPAAMTNLAREGLAERATMVGDVMVDAHQAVAATDPPLPEAGRTHEGYMLLTLHRPSNVDDPDRLHAWLSAAAAVGPVLFPVHPRTKAVLAGTEATVPDGVVLLEPAGYRDMVALESQARVIATDSGGVQKEAYLSGVPCVTLRHETEWVETLETGWNRLSPEPGSLADAVLAAAHLPHETPRPPLFGDGHAADRIVAALERLVMTPSPAGVAS